MTIEDSIRAALSAALPGAEIDVRGDGRHFQLAVVSSAFEGKNTLERHRLVLGALKELMAGDAAPVHAVDSIQARTP
ncbi:MAG: BolA/IbaG family iron-sulfur metabolism protein [Deltaproteobacteria bacterium]|nr:BolA/IbaG family iron-sulfur metabolism protein [Deltaproteobacteria bacterium]